MQHVTFAVSNIFVIFCVIFTKNILVKTDSKQTVFQCKYILNQKYIFLKLQIKQRLNKNLLFQSFYFKMYFNATYFCHYFSIICEICKQFLSENHFSVHLFQCTLCFLFFLLKIYKTLPDLDANIIVDVHAILMCPEETTYLPIPLMHRSPSGPYFVA